MAGYSGRTRKYCPWKVFLPLARRGGKTNNVKGQKRELKAHEWKGQKTGKNSRNIKDLARTKTFYILNKFSE